MINLNKGISTPIALTIIIVLAVVLVGGVFAYQYYTTQKETKIPEIKALETPKTETPKDETAGWKIYRNENLGISFKYPNDWDNLVLTEEDNFIKKLPGTSIGYYDLDKVIYFKAFSHDYVPFETTIFNKKPVNVNWSKSEFATNMGFKKEDVLLVKKLDEKSILVAMYENFECSPSMKLVVLTPLNNYYPNFEIIIASFPCEISDIKDETLNICDNLNVYSKLAEKIDKKECEPELYNYIETARLIADSLEMKTPQEEIIGWKTFKSLDNMKFSIQYPSDWKVSQKQIFLTRKTPTIDSVHFFKDKFEFEIRVGINHFQNPSGLQSWVETTKIINNYITEFKEENITLDNISAVKLTHTNKQNSIVHMIYVQKNRNLYEIITEINPDKKELYDDLIFNQMLSTFRFID